MVSKPKFRRRRRRKACLTRKTVSPRSYLQNYGVPQKSRRKLTYSETINLTSSSGVLSNYVFTGNGLFDPNATGTGHQPYGYDQLSIIYNNYRVIGAKCHVDIVNNGTQTAIQHVGCVAAKSAVFPTLVLSTMYEKGRGKHMAMLGANSRDRFKTTISASTKSIWAVKDIADDVKFSATTIANPTNLWYFHIFNQSVNTTTTGVWANVVIEYMVEYFNPIIADQS